MTTVTTLISPTDPISALLGIPRARILRVLAEHNEITVGELVAILADIPQPTVSRHLRRLSDRGLVTSYRDPRPGRGSTVLNVLDLAGVTACGESFNALSGGTA